MKQDQKTQRQERIAKAAYELLEEQGYAGISMLKIARRARASNETLYRWYGDKKGLFQMLVKENAAEVTAVLQEGLSNKMPPEAVLDILGPRLLSVLLGNRAVALNRAAAADASGELGQSLSRYGRAAVMPLIEQVFLGLCVTRRKPTAKAALFADLYFRLLVGDLQIRRVSGGLAELKPAAMEHRAEMAKKCVLQLMNAPENA